MPRSLSATVKQALYQPQTAEVFLLLLTIDHADLAVPIRVVNNLENVTSNGNLFVGLPFGIDLPTDRDDQSPRMAIRLDNVDRAIVEAIRSITTPPTITLDVVLASAPNTVEASFVGFTLRDVRYDALVVEGTLALEDILGEPFPAHSFTPADFPSVF